MLLSHFAQLYEHELTFLAHILYTENKKDFLWKHLFLNFFIYLPLLSKFSFCGGFDDSAVLALIAKVFFEFLLS